MDEERVGKLSSRLHGWLKLRATPPAKRRLALLVYGFPPNVGATGTAALLDVPASLDAMLASMLNARALFVVAQLGNPALLPR